MDRNGMEWNEAAEKIVCLNDYHFSNEFFALLLFSTFESLSTLLSSFSFINKVINS